MNAIILAAGFGQRMRPVTDVLPKPLFPIAGVPVIHKAIQNLVRSGVKHIIVNVHHLPDLIKRELSQISDTVITFSEEPEILGTAGGIRTAMEVLGTGDYIVVNSDILLEIDFNSVIQFHKKKKALCTMIVRKDKAAKQYGALGIGSAGKIQSFLGKPQTKSSLPLYMYTGLQIMHSDFLSKVPPFQYCDISKEIYPHFANKDEGFYGFATDDYWADIGTPTQYLNANKRFLTQQSDQKDNIGVNECCFIGENTDVHPNSDIGYFCSISSGCIIEQGAVIKNSVIMKNSVIGSNTVVNNSIIGPSTIIPSKTLVDGKIAASIKGTISYTSY